MTDRDYLHQIIGDGVDRLTDDECEAIAEVHRQRHENIVAAVLELIRSLPDTKAQQTALYRVAGELCRDRERAARGL